MYINTRIKLLMPLFGAVNLFVHAHAQDGLRMPDPLASLTQYERKALEQQASSLYNASLPSVAAAAKSTLSVSQSGKRLCYATAVEMPGKKRPVVLTKWSEIRHTNRLTLTTNSGQNFPAVILGVYPEHDLALLDWSGPSTALKPIKIARDQSPELGSFLMLANPYGTVESLGVVSVKPRSLRDGDKAFLGIQMDQNTGNSAGVLINEIVPGSAAQKAGLLKGDLIIAMDKVPVNGFMEMRSRLQRLRPGSKTLITYTRANTRRNTTVSLGSLGQNTAIRRVPPERMQIMQRMGAIPSRVRTDFPSVIQTDMPIHPRDTGAPVADLDGNTVGIAIARGSRIKTFIIPSATLYNLLRTAPLPVKQVLATETNRKNQNIKRIRPRSSNRDEDPMSRVRRLLEQFGR